MLVLALAGCSGGIPRDADPRVGIGNLFGAHLEGREPPPGLDQPYPNLASVPPRPVPPDRASRAAISTGLVDDREGSRNPGSPTGSGRGAPGAAPPAPPSLAAAPRVRIDPASPPAPGPAPAAVVTPEEPRPRLAAPPPAPAPDLLAPPPAPSGDLLAPPPAPTGDLLAPRTN